MNIISNVFVGVDVSKESLDVYMNPIGKSFKIKNNVSGFKKLIKELSNHNVKHIVCESSGSYENNFIVEMHKVGYSTCQVDPKRIKAFALSEGVKAKTDSIDAKMIALFAENKKFKYRPRCTNSEELIKLRSMVDVQVSLKKQISNEKKRIKLFHYQYCQKHIEAHITFMKKQILELNEQINDSIENNSEWHEKSNLLTSVPGIGKTTAAALIAHMPELGPLHPKKAAALIGLAPYTKQSGKCTGLAKIQGGRFIPRSAIYMAALTAIRYNPILKKFYDKLLSAGKKPKVGLVAVMRKLIIITNAILKNKTPWKIEDKTT